MNSPKLSLDVCNTTSSSSLLILLPVVVGYQELIGFYPGSVNIPSIQVSKTRCTLPFKLLGKLQGIIRDNLGEFLLHESKGKVLKASPFSRIQILEQSETITELQNKIWRAITPY